MDVDLCGAESSALVDQLRTGGAVALAEQFSLYRERFWRIIELRLDPRLSGRVDPDDVLQETYLDASRRLDHFLNSTEMSLFVWLRLTLGQTMINVHRRHLGSQQRDARREQRSNLGSATSLTIADQLATQLTSPSHAAMRSEQAAELEHVIEQLSPLDREVLVLRHFEDLSNQEVAQLLGIQQKAASIRYIRAIARLKDILAHTPAFAHE